MKKKKEKKRRGMEMVDGGGWVESGDYYFPPFKFTSVVLNLGSLAPRGPHSVSISRSRGGSHWHLVG